MFNHCLTNCKKVTSLTSVTQRVLFVVAYVFIYCSDQCMLSFNVVVDYIVFNRSKCMLSFLVLISFQSRFSQIQKHCVFFCFPSSAPLWPCGSGFCAGEHNVLWFRTYASPVPFLHVWWFGSGLTWTSIEWKSKHEWKGVFRWTAIGHIHFNELRLKHSVK